MATKTTKKAPAKRPAAKKVAPAKKAAPKKTARAAAPVMEEAVIITTPEMHAHHDHGCGCGGHGDCGKDCGCGGHCGCHGCQCGGGCWRFIKKLFWFLVIFALGFAACMCVCRYGNHGRRAPKMPVEFVNGCLDVTQIKCAEFASKVTVADVNNDNCITREEYRAFKKKMHKHK